MHTPESGLDITSKRIFVALLLQLEEKQLQGWKEVFGKTVLWYYMSPLALIPDFIPGLGYIDNFCLSQLTLWLCSVNPDSVEPEDMDNFTHRCEEVLAGTSEPTLTTTDTAQE